MPLLVSWRTIYLTVKLDLINIYVIDMVLVVVCMTLQMAKHNLQAHPIVTITYTSYIGRHIITIL